MREIILIDGKECIVEPYVKDEIDRLRFKVEMLEQTKWYLHPSNDTPTSPYKGRGRTWIQYAQDEFKERKRLEGELVIKTEQFKELAKEMAAVLEVFENCHDSCDIVEGLERELSKHKPIVDIVMGMDLSELTYEAEYDSRMESFCFFCGNLMDNGHSGFCDGVKLQAAISAARKEKE